MLISKLVNGGLKRSYQVLMVQFRSPTKHRWFDTLPVRAATNPEQWPPWREAYSLHVRLRLETCQALPSPSELQHSCVGADLLGANARAAQRTTNTEVVITTSLIDSNRYLMRKTDVYYIEDIEGIMFEAPFRPQTKAMGVTGQ
jgi:hypothetical protein